MNDNVTVKDETDKATCDTEQKEAGGQISKISREFNT